MSYPLSNNIPCSQKQKRAQARNNQEKQDKVTDVKLITTYNSALHNINKIVERV